MAENKKRKGHVNLSFVNLYAHQFLNSCCACIFLVFPPWVLLFVIQKGFIFHEYLFFIFCRRQLCDDFVDLTVSPGMKRIYYVNLFWYCHIYFYSCFPKIYLFYHSDKDGKSKQEGFMGQLWCNKLHTVNFIGKWNKIA